MFSLHEFLIHVIGNCIVCIPIFCLKNLCCHRVSFEIGSYSCSYSFLIYKYVFHTYIWYICSFVAGMSAMLDVFVVRYQYLPKSDLGRIWHYADDTYRLV